MISFCPSLPPTVAAPFLQPTPWRHPLRAFAFLLQLSVQSPARSRPPVAPRLMLPLCPPLRLLPRSSPPARIRILGMRRRAEHRRAVKLVQRRWSGVGGKDRRDRREMRRALFAASSLSPPHDTILPLQPLAQHPPHPPPHAVYTSVLSISALLRRGSARRALQSNGPLMHLPSLSSYSVVTYLKSLILICGNTGVTQPSPPHPPLTQPHTHAPVSCYRCCVYLVHSARRTLPPS
jgi:hypothetical protein